MKYQNQLIAGLIWSAAILNVIPSQAQNTFPYPATGNIGIGTNTPAALLHVNGNMLINDKITGGVSHSYLLLSSSEGSKISWGTGTAETFILVGGSAVIWANGAERFRVNPNGSVGIGTQTPAGRLDVEGNANLLTGTHKMYINEGVVTDNTRAGLRNNAGSLAINAKNSGVLYLNRDASAETRIQSNSVDIAIFKSDGTVGIGTTDPKGYRLAVNGDAIFTKVKVKAYGNWPDYVFHPAYSLRPLSEIEKYIKAYQHLPEVPSSKEMEKNGLDLGENQALLLKKIEELTLYMIEQEKRIKVMEAKIKLLEKN